MDLSLLGQMTTSRSLNHLRDWLSTLGYPILADPLSQLRCGVSQQSMVLTSYDAFLRIDTFIERAQPELIIRFGAMPTSKPLLLYLKATCIHSTRGH